VHALTRSRQDYLKARFAPAPEGGAVPTPRLAAPLGVSAPPVASRVACPAAGRHTGDRVLRAIDRLMDHPAEDPHGHPIPGARGGSHGA
jgi:Mn-dependent DtxR family transcriptional regulator